MTIDMFAEKKLKTHFVWGLLRSHLDDDLRV